MRPTRDMLEKLFTFEVNFVVVPAFLKNRFGFEKLQLRI
jgi:hypothetical protein